MADPRIRIIKIKTGVVRRLAKEKVVYEREAEAQKIRIEKLKAQGKDEYELRKQDEVLAEGLMMVPDCQRRLAVAYDDLKNILDTEKDLQDTADYIAAQKILDEAKIQLPKHFSNRNVNIEVPIMTDPRTNILQSIYSQSNDEIWIDSWLQQNSVYHPIPKIRVNKASHVISIHEAQNSLRECLKLLEKLTQTHHELESNVDRIPSNEWKQKTVEIGNIKDQFTRVVSKFENGDAIFALMKTINKRKKKRSNQRKKKEFRKRQLDDKFHMREKLHASIDQWLASKKEDDEKFKMKEDMKKDADCVLAEVTKKKSDARKQMALIGSLAKLRFIRHHMAVQRGEKPSLEDQNAFNITVIKLKNMWESSLKTYTKEEQGLKLMLEKTASEDSKTAELTKERKLLGEWHTVFFGPRQIVSQDNVTYWALTAAERDMETFIAIRKSWDTFLVSPTNEMGSKIPVGWVLPDANESWAKYLSTV